MIDRLNTIARRVPTWVVYIVGLLPIPWLLFQAQTGGLGAEPIKALEKELGLLALQLLIAGLVITPARRYLRLNLIKFRRALGLLAFICLSGPPGGQIEQLLDPQAWGHVAQAAPVNLSGCNFGWGALHLAGQRFPDRTSPLYGGDSGFAAAPTPQTALIPNPGGGSRRGLCRIRTGGGETIHISAASLWITCAGVSDAGQ